MGTITEGLFSIIVTAKVQNWGNDVLSDGNYTSTLMTRKGQLMCVMVAKFVGT